MQTPTPFTQALSRLNPNQRAAVEQTDGPLLVIAGPGTGKTQLLSARVAYILQHTDTLPQNILCLTFTEIGAQNMRERLSSFIGQAAYDVTISTYHAFGGDLIGRFPQYFGDHQAQQAADRLAQHEIVQGIVGAMSLSNPLKSTQHHLGDLLATIGEVKRALLTEDDLRNIAEDNLRFIDEANQQISQIFADFTTMPRRAELALPYFTNLRDYLRQRDQPAYRLATGSIIPLADVVLFELEQAIAAAEAGDSPSAGKPSTKPLTAWKNQWLAKDADNHFVLAGERESRRLATLADVMRQYQQQLASRGLYDFDDMILRSIAALRQHADLRYSLQEQYQYIMLDEFQDTNAAQMQLIKLLTDNPVHEGRPNVMAVGDDDQAIYAFQGAEVSNMLEFAQAYRDTRVINLTDNYRSHPEILHVAHEVAKQIGGRLEHSFKDMSKLLRAANRDIPPQAHIDRHEFQSDVGQYDWLAQQIAKLIKNGAKPSEIAVLAPRHKQLEPLVPYLNRLDIPVRYEKRENILEAPVVRQLLTMARLVLALQAGRQAEADALWPEVLSYNFWQLPTSALWQLSWRVRQTDGLTWSQAVINDDTDPTFRQPGLLLLAAARQAGSQTLETMLDYLIGNEPIVTGEDDMPTLVSPLKQFYMGPAARQAGRGRQAGQGRQGDAPRQASDGGADLFYQTLSHLTCLRERLRDHQASRRLANDTPSPGQDGDPGADGGQSHDEQTRPLMLPDLLHFVSLYEGAGERLTNTSPYNQHAEAVQLMTVFKAKGLEFEHVFLPSVQDDVWGESSRAQANRLTLPANLAPIRQAATTQDERLRIFFVAITRAKLGLHLTSYLQTYSGRSTRRLKYLNEQPAADGTDGFKTLILPPERQAVRRIDHQPPELSTLELNWRQRHVTGLRDTDLKALLHSKLQDFRLTPTQLCSFSDLIYGGPEVFFFDCLLGFPRARHIEADYGTAMHETLRWLQQQFDAHQALPSRQAAQRYYQAQLQRCRLLPQDYANYLEKGQRALDCFIAQRGSIFRVGNRAEYSFSHENVRLGDAWLTGKLDLMRVDQAARRITVVDYKTGAWFDRWQADAKLHKYKRQLLVYKLLIEHSRSFKGYSVGSGRLEFVDPDDNGRIHSLEMEFSPEDVRQTEQLIQAVWRCVQTLQLPDVSGYDQTLSGIKQFEADLLASNA